MTAEPMRPRLAGDVRFVRSAQGAYLHGMHGDCTLSGVQAYDWLARLAPHLTGERTLQELTSGLAAAKREMVERLVGVLAENGFVVDARADEPHSLSERECAIYADEIRFIRYCLDSAERRFQRFREARILLLGSGPLLADLLGAGLRAGWRTVGVAAHGTGDSARLATAADRARRDAQQHVEFPGQVPATPAGPAGLAGLFRTWDVVLQVCTHGERAGLLAACRAAGQAGAALGQLYVDSTEAWLTSVGPPAATMAESGWRRLAGPPPAGIGSGTDAPPGAGWLTGPVPVFLGMRLALACFRYLTGLDTLPEARAAGPAMTRIDLDTLVSTRHRFLAHPLASAASPRTRAQARVTADTLTSSPPVDPDELLNRAALCVDQRCGLLSGLDEGDLPQFPLRLCRAVVRDPCGLLPDGAPALTVTECGTDARTARVRALLSAVAVYGALAVDRRCFGRSGGPRSRGGPDDGRVWGVDLVTGEPREVRTCETFPVLRGARTPFRLPAGTAAGLTWAGAVTAGLRQHCEAILAGRAARCQAPERLLSRAELPLTGPAAHLARLAEVAAAPVRVRDLTPAIGIPAYQLAMPGGAHVIACGPTPQEALRDGLERLLYGWQTGLSSKPAAPVTGPEDSAVPGGLITALRAAGRTPVAVLLDHDSEVARILPFALRVVLCHDNG